MLQPRFIRAVNNGADIEEDGYAFAFMKERLVLLAAGEGAKVPWRAILQAAGVPLETVLPLGRLDGTPCFACDLAEAELPNGFQSVDLRQAFGMLPELEYGIAGFAAHLSHWNRTTVFCPLCGAETERVATEHAKRCSSCGFMQYPRVSPAIIVLIYRPGQILLTRQPSWPPNRYSLVAGFVEAGESLEECLRREIAEEVGVTVGELRYLGSQPWPYPHQLMVGFLARYRAGEIHLSDQELEHAAWFDLDALPDLPPPLSISRRILDWHLASQHEPGLPFPVFDTLA